METFGRIVYAPGGGRVSAVDGQSVKHIDCLGILTNFRVNKCRVANSSVRGLGIAVALNAIYTHEAIKEPQHAMQP